MPTRLNWPNHGQSVVVKCGLLGTQSGQKVVNKWSTVVNYDLLGPQSGQQMVNKWSTIVNCGFLGP